MLICKAPTGDTDGHPQTLDLLKFEFLEDHLDSPSSQPNKNSFKSETDTSNHQHFEASSQQHLLDIIADLSIDSNGNHDHKVKETVEEEEDYLQLMDS